jgi:transposase
MSNYIGLDVSLKTTAICIMNPAGKILTEMTASTDACSIVAMIQKHELPIEKAALECGGMSHWLTKELNDQGLPTICIDARKMSAAIKIRVNKTDKNDAQEIANALRTGYYKEVYQKQDHVMEKQTLLTVRRSLIDQRTQLTNTIRGLLKLYGKLHCGSSENKVRFKEKVLNEINSLGQDVQLGINALLAPFDVICREVEKIDNRVEELTKNDEDVQLLKTILGVGAITALTFKLEIDDPSRFKKSRSVGAYVGMTPTQYSSGETIKQGSISKAGSNELRAMVCQSAMSIMYRVKSWSRLKLFGLRIKKQHGHKKAVVALGRKLCVVMHRMLVTRQSFEPGNVEQREIDKLVKLSKRQAAKAEKVKEKPEKKK